MTPIRVVIVDDERPARRRIRELLESDGRAQVIAECEDGTAAVETILEQKPDLVFLDVQMPELDGLGVVEAVGVEQMPLTIFVTAYDQYALRAFDVHAFDYLLKPYSDERFEEALSRAIRQLALAEQDDWRARLLALVARQGDQAGGRLDRLVIKTAGRIRFVRVEDIDRLEAAGVYVRIYARGAAHVLRESLTSLVDRLDPARFVRVHRSHVINLDRVKELQRTAGGDLDAVMNDGTRLRISRGFREALEQRLGQEL